MIIETERMILREYTLQDFNALYEIMSDAETMQHYPNPFDLETRILAVIQAETVEKIRERLTEVFILTDGYLQVPKKKELPSTENLRGTYEEMYSNWKNKMAEASGRDDVYSSFMNLLSLQWMFYEIAECIAEDDFEIMDKFSPKIWRRMWMSSIRL